MGPLMTFDMDRPYPPPPVRPAALPPPPPPAIIRLPFLPAALPSYSTVFCVSEDSPPPSQSEPVKTVPDTTPTAPRRFRRDCVLTNSLPIKSKNSQVDSLHVVSAHWTRGNRHDFRHYMGIGVQIMK
jgi:hypothetical protein